MADVSVVWVCHISPAKNRLPVHDNAGWVCVQSWLPVPSWMGKAKVTLHVEGLDAREVGLVSLWLEDDVYLND